MRYRSQKSPLETFFQPQEEVDLPGVFPLFCTRPTKTVWVDATGTPTEAVSPEALINVSPTRPGPAVRFDRNSDPC